MQIVNSINDLSTLTAIENEKVYVNYHTYPWDSGGGYFTLINKSRIVLRGTTTPRNPDGGIIIKSNYNINCLWLRDIPGEINVRFYGSGNDGDRIQKAINYAAENYINDIATHGCTVFLPGMEYSVKGTLILKEGVSLKGDSLQTTIIKAIYTGNATEDNGYLLSTPPGRISGINISDIIFDGGITPDVNNWTGAADTKTKGGMYFGATAGEYGDGGVWYCTFKNIAIKHFNGNGMVFVGGTTTYNLPHQCNIFENVVVTRQKDAAQALSLIGQIGQFSFINSAFGGFFWGSGDVRHALKGVNCYLGNEIDTLSKAGLTPTVVTFLNCTFQDSEYAVKTKCSDGVTFDNCWFENLDFSFLIESDMNGRPSKVNILNSNFANAASFGSYNVDGEHTTTAGGDYPGACIVSKGSYINVHNNHVVTSGTEIWALSKYFILAFDGNKGVRATGNTFGHPLLGLTSGITQTISTISSGVLEAFGNGTNMLSVSSAQTVNTINSTCLAGERIVFKVRPGTANNITFSNSGNIRLGSSASLAVAPGRTVEFVKTDSNIEGTFYQLTSIY